MRLKIRFNQARDFDLIALKSAKGFAFQSLFRLAVVRYIGGERGACIPLPEYPQSLKDIKEFVLILPDDADIEAFFDKLPGGTKSAVAKNIFRQSLSGLFLPGERRKEPENIVLVKEKRVVKRVPKPPPQKKPEPLPQTITPPVMEQIQEQKNQAPSVAPVDSDRGFSFQKF